MSTTPAPSGGRESAQSWAQRKKDLPEQRKPRKGSKGAAGAAGTDGTLRGP